VLARYEIRIAHPLDEMVAAAFEGFEVAGEGDFTVVSGEFDQAALHGTLERIRMLALELVDARRIRGTTRRRCD
jgi:hypothetical protein